MVKTLFICLLISFFLTLIFGKIFLIIARKKKVGQPILKYVKEHEKKSGTPTMAGLFFVFSSAITFVIFGGFSGKIANLCLIITISFMLIGLIDDCIKLKFKQNEGLKAYQKILFQVGISIAVGVYAFNNNLTYAFLPFSNKVVNLSYFTIPFLIIVFIATSNSVNLTDGLDGLAGSTSVVYLIFLSALIYFENTKNNYVYLMPDEYGNILILSSSFIGGLIGFLFFNVYPAKVFMGDTGSMALGGLIASISIFSLNSFYILILGITFVFSSVSVIIQVIYYKKTKKRVFLMTPFHHHLQLKGNSESKIALIYSTITGIMGVLSIIFYL